MGNNRKRRSSNLKMLLATLVALLPALVLTGSMAGSAQAGVPTGNVPVAQTQRIDVLVLHVYYRDAAERDRLAAELDPEEEATSGNYLTVLGDHAMYNDLSSRGLHVEIDQEATSRVSAAYNGVNVPGTFYGGYKTVEDMKAWMDSVVAAYPNLAEEVDFGDSWCKVHPGSCTQPAPYNGYDMLALHITNRSIPGPKPVYWFDGAIHAREIAVPEMVMRLGMWLLPGYNLGNGPQGGYDSDPDAHWLVDYHDIYLIPTANPDGHHIVESGGGGNSPYYQRKNANNTNGCTTWPPSVGTQFGTDNNRNFTYLWNCCGGSSGAACSQTYHGPSAGSDPETQSIMNEISLLIPDQRGPNNDPAPITTTGIVQSMHSNASLNLYPWGYTTSSAPNGAELGNLARHFSARNAFPAGNGYQACQPPQCLYAVDGDSFDWSYGELGPASFTTEVSGADFLIPFTCIDHPCSDPELTTESMWQQNGGALIYQTKVARTPYLLAHGPDTTLATTTPMTVTQGTPSQLTATINYAWTGNTLAQNVGAAEYYIDTPPWAGGTGIAMSGTYGGSQTVPVTASVDTSSLAPGRHLIYIRGRGVNQVQSLDTWGPISAAWLWVLPAGSVTPTATTQPTNTTQPTSTNTAVAPSATSTSTVAASATSTQPAATETQPAATNTSEAATATETQGVASVTATETQGVATATSTSEVATETSTVQPTATTCSISFSDVPPGSTFYTWIECLACRGIISGYPDGSFRPNAEITRGQISKMVALSAGYHEGAGTQVYEDVPPGSPFEVYVNEMSRHGVMGGYPCGTRPDEPCVPPANRPYFRPNENASRGALAKIASNAAGYTENHTSQTFEDVGPAHPYYLFVERLATRNVMQGYACGQVPEEPCIPPGNRPYFRPYATVTRGQASKIVANTFFPGCNPQLPTK